ncbi:MAG: N-acetylmuramoyl-L-alanine amidase [Pseudomonadota bacterium]
MPAESDEALWHPSPNFGDRRQNGSVRLVVLHYTAMESAAAALERLCDPSFEVSAHYLIGNDGQLWQLVPEAKRAWHAGAGQWGEITDVNSYSIGIELDNLGHAPFAEPLMQRLIEILRVLLARYALPPEAVIGHSDMAPVRKRDPGRAFPWARLAEQGLSVWPETPQPLAPDETRFAEAAFDFGYPVAPVDHLLEAIRQRFRPKASGPLSSDDMGVMVDLARRFPVDRGSQNA